MPARRKLAASRRPAAPPKLAAALLLLANLLKRSASSAFGKQMGLSPIAWGLIGHLGLDGPMTQSEIAEKYLIDKGQLSRTAVGLARQGLIVRASRTWRSNELRLAPRGRKLFAHIERIVRQRERDLVRGLTPRELKALRRSLTLINANATALLAEH